MSRINTRILRVPGVSGQIDERPMGSFMAPLEAAGEALADLGDLGQQIAVKEQELDDTLLISDLQKSAEESSLRAAYELENAESVQDMEAIQRALQADFESLSEQAKGIGSRRRQGLFQDQLTLMGGKAALGAMSAVNNRKISDTRFKVLQTAKAAWESGVATGNYDAAKKEVRRLLEETKGSAWTPAEVEAQYEALTGRSDYFESLVAIRDGREVDLSSKRLSQGDRASLEIAMMGKREEERSALNARMISRGPGYASDAARGMFKGEAVGPDKALRLLMKEADSLEFLDEEDRRLYKENLQTVFDLAGLGMRIDAITITPSDNESKLDAIDGVLSDLQSGKTPLAGEELAKTISSVSAYRDAIAADGERESVKEQRARIEGHVLNLNKAREAVEAGYKEVSDKGAALKAFQQAAYEAVGIRDGDDSRSYRGGEKEYFEAKQLADGFVADFTKSLGKIRTWESVSLGVQAGDQKSIDSMGSWFIGIDQQTGGMDPSRLLGAIEYLKGKGDLETEFAPEQELAGQRLQQVLFMSLNQPGKKMPPVFDAWINQLNGELSPDQRAQIMGAISDLRSTNLFDIDLNKDFAGLGRHARNQLVSFSMNSHLEPKARLQKAMEADSYDPEEMAKLNSWATDDHISAIVGSISQKMKLPLSSNTPQALMASVLQDRRSVSPEDAATLAVAFGDRMMQHLLADLGPDLAGMDPSYVVTAMNRNEELPKVMDSALAKSIGDTAGRAGGTRTAVAGETVVVPDPIENYLNGPSSDFDKKDYEPVFNAVADWWGSLPDAAKVQIGGAAVGEGSPFPIKEMDRWANLYSSTDTHLRSTPGKAVETYSEFIEMNRKLRAGEIEESEYDDFMRSGEFYHTMNRGAFERFGDWATGLQGPTPSQVKFDPKEGIRFILENFDIVVSPQEMPEGDSQEINDFFALNAPYLGENLFGAGGKRYHLTVRPRVGGKGIEGFGEFGEVPFRLNHYTRSADVILRLRENATKPESTTHPSLGPAFNPWIRTSGVPAK